MPSRHTQVHPSQIYSVHEYEKDTCGVQYEFQIKPRINHEPYYYKGQLKPNTSGIPTLRGYAAQYSKPRGYDVSLREEADAVKKATREWHAEQREQRANQSKQPVKQAPSQPPRAKSAWSWKTIVGIPRFIGRAIATLLLYVIGGAVAIAMH